MASIIAGSLEIIFMGTIGVAGIALIETANTTGWSATTKLLLPIISIGFIIGAILLLLDKAGFKIKV